MSKTDSNKELKKEIAKLRRYIKYFWHNEDILEMYGFRVDKTISEMLLATAKKELVSLESQLKQKTLTM